jgi:hypothetical protein
LELVIKNAERYMITQHIDNASPYSPNSFEILAKIGRGSARVISFLDHELQDEWDIPKWAAIEAACKLDDANADEIVSEVIRGASLP